MRNEWCNALALITPYDFNLVYPGTLRNPDRRSNDAILA
jgi:hypothetical protein